MKRRKLDPCDSLKDQFTALRQIPSLTQSECRQVVALLHDNEEGAGTCKRLEHAHPLALPCMRQIMVPRDGPPLQIHCMSLEALIEAKTKVCPLFAACMQRMYERYGAQQPLIIYADDTHGGNVLAAPASRKSTLVYAAFLNFEFLHLESLWMTLSVIKAADNETCRGGFASVLTSLWSHYKEETQHGLPVRIGAAFELLLIPHVMLLSDHEGIRSALGCKGASGFKPCIKCRNVLMLHRAEDIPSHVDVSCSDPEQFLRQTQRDVDDVFDILQRQTTRKKREETEVMLGFKLSSLAESPLTQRNLRGFFSLEHVQFDSMHHLFSNGLVAQELGLWFSRAHQMAGVSVEHMTRYMQIAWAPLKGGQIDPPRADKHFTSKLWRLDQDFRGDAQACLEVLPLCVAYGEEMCRGRYAGMESALNSLAALHAVVICLKACKDSVTAASRLLVLQREHMQRFVDAYTTGERRPKLHYSLHLAEQMQERGRPFDAFVCERKHRHFKSICNGKLNQPGKANFARSALLELVSMELATPQSVSKLETQLQGSASSSCALSKLLGSCKPVQVASALEHRGIRYGKGQFFLLPNSKAMEVLSAVQAGDTFFLLVTMLEPVGDQNHPGRTQWMRTGSGQGSQALLPVTDATNSNCSQCMYVRHDNNTLWLLQ